LAANVSPRKAKVKKSELIKLNGCVLPAHNSQEALEKLEELLKPKKGQVSPKLYLAALKRDGEDDTFELWFQRDTPLK
jgi:hypothetical protein